MINLNKTIWYKGESICYDDFGYYTVFYEGDDVMFDTVEDAKQFIDDNFDIDESFVRLIGED